MTLHNLMNLDFVCSSPYPVPTYFGVGIVLACLSCTVEYIFTRKVQQPFPCIIVMWPVLGFMAVTIVGVFGPPFLCVYAIDRLFFREFPPAEESNS